MHIFECEQCSTCDSIHATQQTGERIGYYCHRCLHGDWHNEFLEEAYSYEKHGPALNKVNPAGDDGWPSFS